MVQGWDDLVLKYSRFLPLSESAKRAIGTASHSDTTKCFLFNNFALLKLQNFPNNLGNCRERGGWKGAGKCTLFPADAPFASNGSLKISL